MGQLLNKSAFEMLVLGLIDYAGLFPPASLSLADAMARYERYRRGDHLWLLGSFILPRVQLGDFAAQAQTAIAQGWQLRPWHLSVLASDDLDADARAVDAYSSRYERLAPISAIEAKAATPDDVRRIVAALPASMPLWLEIAPGPAGDRLLDELLDAIAAAGAHVGAKLRTGGTTREAIPPAEAIARFMLACARHRVMWKATAGLHHPLPARHRLTYADNSPTAAMHGFVNVFLAAVLAKRATHSDLVTLLNDGDAEHFEWHEQYVRWQGAPPISTADIMKTRAQFARSFGSCSFDEPIDDLKQLGWL